MISMCKIAIVGIGYDGNQYLEKFHKNVSNTIKTISIDTCNFLLEKYTSQIKINISEGEVLGLDGGSPQRSETFAFKHYDKIFNALSDADLVISLAKLSDDDGAGVTPLVANIAKDIGAVSVAVVCDPFSFESLRRRKIALDSLIKLNSAADYVCVPESDYIISNCDPKTLISAVFEIISDWVVETLSQILNCYHQLKSDKPTLYPLLSTLYPLTSKKETINFGRTKNSPRRLGDNRRLGYSFKQLSE